MDLRGQYALYEPFTGLITLRVGKLTPDQLERLEKARDKDLDVSVKIHRKKRSLDANSYLWLILSKMAEVLKTSKDEVYETCIQKYGYVDEDVIITVLREVDMSKIDGHWHFIRNSSDMKYSAYVKIRGTSEYNTTEFSHFLDMVIQDAKDLGVETATPTEIAEMKRLYEQRYGEPQG